MNRNKWRVSILNRPQDKNASFVVRSPGCDQPIHLRCNRHIWCARWFEFDTALKTATLQAKLDGKRI